MKKILPILIILAILIIIISMNENKKDGSSLMIDVFNESTFKTVQSDINTYAILKQPLKTFDDMELYLKNVDEKIGGISKDTIEKEEIDDIKILKKVYISSNAKLTTKIETINDNATYLIIDVILYDNCENIMKVKEEVEDIFKILNLDLKTNISITGSYHGKINYDEEKLIAFDIMKKMNATILEDYITDKVYSVVGYTKRINEYIYSEKQKININLALRYNEYENKTYLYLATPLITVEY